MLEEKNAAKREKLKTAKILSGGPDLLLLRNGEGTTGRRR